MYVYVDTRFYWIIHFLQILEIGFKRRKYEMEKLIRSIIHLVVGQDR
jgi:hypothetical protein